MKIVFTSSVLKLFVDFTFNKIVSRFGWEKLETYLSSGVNANKKSLNVKALDIKLPNIFYISDKPGTKEDLSYGGYVRYNLTPVFESDNLYCHLNTEWGLDSSALKLADLKEFVNSEFGEFFNIDTHTSPKLFVFTETINNDLAVISKLDVNLTARPAQNKIYFGCPGTGKSYQLREQNTADKVFKTTFHPEYDYAAFVGAYKPKMVNEKIVYDFTPQIFTDAYVYAYEHDTENVVLQIEEINRGNCALIFGDIFQLLDRAENGESEYGITPDADLADYLRKHVKGFNEEMKLPANLSILATMNTSDQSLFPMDSAFKRRWEWEYVPIDLATAQTMTFVANDKTYNWSDFLKVVNQKIYDVTKSEDKQMGTFFVSGPRDIKAEEFKNKVMYYLWFDVFKNYDSNEKEYIFKSDKGGSEHPFTFSDLFKTQDDTLLEGFLTRLGLKPTPENTETTEIA